MTRVRRSRVSGDVDVLVGMLGRGVRDVAAAATAVVAFSAVALAAYLPGARLPVAAALVAWLLVGRGRGRTAPPALMALLPVSLILGWGALPQPVAAPGSGWCASPVSPPAVWRLAEAVVALGAVGLLVGGLPGWRAELGALGLRRASSRVLAASAAAFVVAGALALSGGSLVGGMFFGSFGLDVGRVGALVPALVFAVSNAVAEEVAYRGAMRVWLGPVLGVLGANLAQAVVFGLAHTGADFQGPVLPVVVSMILVGFVGGVIARRTGSLAFPIAVHAAADLPIYYYWACRVPA